MGRTLKEKMASLPRSRRDRIRARAEELIEHELSLRDLRKAMHLTQVEVAARMKVGQDAVSRYEQRTDLMLSTLQRFVSAMGGTLCLIAEFPDREPVRVRTLAELSSASNGASQRRKARRS